jgi:hypothetical protein
VVAAVREATQAELLEHGCTRRPSIVAIARRPSSSPKALSGKLPTKKLADTLCDVVVRAWLNEK